MSKAVFVPKLRFPEFLDAGDWEGKRLEDFCEIISGHPVTGHDILETKTPVRLLRGINITEGRIRHSLDIDRFHGSYKNNLHRFILEVGDIVIGMDGSKVGRNVATINEADAGAFLIQRVARLRKTTTNYLQYAYHHILSPFFHRYVDRINTSSGIPHISLQQIRDFPISSPHPDEQQKIVDCLASVDDLITAEAQKLEALKDHKKGLIQQLFPREGETKPRLRFPEFRYAEDWDSIEIGDIGPASMCKRVMKNETSSSGDIPFFKIGTFGKKPDAYINRDLYEDYKSRFSFPKAGDILISASGTIGRLVVFDGSPSYFQDSNIVWVDNDESLVCNPFLLRCYETTTWTTEGNTIARLYNNNLMGIKVTIPKLDEQRKISDLLASVDDLIAAEAQKLEALKDHKKGLMQQLFPAVDEVTG